MIFISLSFLFLAIITFFNIKKNSDIIMSLVYTNKFIVFLLMSLLKESNDYLILVYISISVFISIAIFQLDIIKQKNIDVEEIR